MEQIAHIMKKIVIGVIGLALSLSASAIAADIAVVVSSRSPMILLNANQVAEIFLGKTNRFPDGSRPIPIDQAEGSAVRDEFYLKF